MYPKFSRSRQWICSHNLVFWPFILFSLAASAADSVSPGSHESQALIKCEDRIALPPEEYFPLNIPRYSFRDLSNFCYTHTVHNAGCHCVRNTNPFIRIGGGAYVIDCTSRAGGNGDLLYSRAITSCYMHCACEPPVDKANPSTGILETLARQTLVESLNSAANYCTSSGHLGSIAERDDQKGAEDPADALCPDGYGCKRVVSVAAMLMWGVGDTFPLGLCGPK